jgi:hypothetical protein
MYRRNESRKPCRNIGVACLAALSLEEIVAANSQEENGGNIGNIVGRWWRAKIIGVTLCGMPGGAARAQLAWLAWRRSSSWPVAAGCMQPLWQWRHGVIENISVALSVFWRSLAIMAYQRNMKAIMAAAIAIMSASGGINGQQRRLKAKVSMALWRNP